MERAKVGIIGCGNISDLYFSNLMVRYGSEIEVVSCADIDAEKARAAAEKHGVEACTVDEMLADPRIEIVVNITIPLAHTEINRRVLMAGKHVYCEKPLAITFEEAKETIALAESKGLFVGCAPDTFLGAGIQTCRQLIDEGWLGKLTCGVANFAFPGHEIWHPNPAFYYKTGGGPMMDMGPYYVTALVAMLGPIKQLFGICTKNRPVRTITSQPYCGTKVDADVPTHYMGMLEFESGVHVSIIMSFEMWNSELPNLEIHGTSGSMYCSNPDLFSGPVFMTRGEAVVDQLSDMDTSNIGVNGDPFDWSTQVKEVPLRYHDPRKKMRGLGVLDLVHAIRDGRKPRVAHDLILHVTEALTAFEKSSASGSVYKMTTPCERPAGMPLDYGLNQVD